MAKKPAAKRGSKAANKSATPSATSAAVQPSETLRVISEKDFHALVKKVKSHEADKNESVGAIGGAINAAVEAKHLHKKAFGTYRMCARMSDNKLSEFLAHFDHYRNIGGLDERASTQGQMIPRTEAGEPEPSERDKEAEAVAGKMGAAQKRSRKKSDPDEDERQEQAAHANGGHRQGSFQAAIRQPGASLAPAGEDEGETTTTH